MVTMIAFPSRAVPSFLGHFAIVCLLAAPLSAQTSWDAGGDATSWGDAANWTTGVPSGSAAITFGDGAPNQAQVIDLGADRTITTGGSIVLSSTGDRSYTLEGGKLILNRDGGNVTFLNNSVGNTTFTVNSDIDLTYTSGSSSTSFTISGTAAREVNLNGDIVAAGTERMVVNAANIRLNLRGNNSMPVFTISNGEVVVYNANATGGGQLQGGTGANAMLSLASDLSLLAPGTVSTFLGGNLSVRIREDVPSSTDRVISFLTRVGVSNSDGKITVVNNADVGSTGRVILNMATTTGATVQNLPIHFEANGLLRFSQTGATIYGASGNGSGLVTGGGDVEFTGGGTTTFTAANTYSGTTTLTNASTLLLSGGGTIEGTSHLHLANGTTFGISGITPAGYTFSESQTVSGLGTITTGGKNLTINGTISPGNSPGMLSLSLGAGTLDLGADVNLVFELGTVSDLVNLTTGTLDIGAGTLGFDNFSFSALSGFGAGEYTLFQTTETIQGSLGTNVSGLIGGFTATIGFDETNTNLILSVIPEPNTVALLLLGGLYLVSKRRKDGARIEVQ